MRTIHFTRVAALAPFPRVLAAGGVEVIRALERAGIAPELVQSPEAFITLNRGSAFVEQVARKEGVESLGFLVGNQTTLGELGTFGLHINRSLTVRDALRRIVRYIPMVNTGARAWMEDVPEREAVRLCIRHHVDTGRKQVDAYALMVLIHIVRKGTGQAWCPERVRFDAAIHKSARIPVLSDAVVESGCGHAAFEIPKHLLSNRFVAEPSPEASARVPEWAGPPDTFVFALMESIRSGFGSRMLDAAEAAQLAGMSVRTMQRRLKDEGYGFRELVDDVRHREARSLLSDQTLPISEISRYLGYPDAANFTHAFRRWTGESPSAFRIRLAG